MDARQLIRIEQIVDRAASTAFALACGFAAYRTIDPLTVGFASFAESGGVAALAYLLSAWALRRIGHSPQHHEVPMFDVRELETDAQLPELLLTERLAASQTAKEETLLLDDILAELGPDARVVRLFDPSKMPSPGELQSRIDRHLEAQPTPQQSADAAEALHAALSALRQSIR